MSGFVDESALHVRGGDGGAGAASFRREAHVPRGGPDGGDGGPGGDVWVVADRHVGSLAAFGEHPHRRAGDGGHGRSKRAHGRSGAELAVGVPVGTVVREPGGTLLADLVGEGDRWRAAAGGRGGRGNASFVSNRRRAPAFAEQGEVGEERWLRLELKLMADVAVIGFPNAGKSTFVSVVSAARPKVADYPFTTLVPHLGVARHGDTELVVADVPGLIEGASQGRGLGHQFLRHVERARALLILVDLASMEGRSPAAQERVLLAELTRYRPELAARPRLVVGSRADATDPVTTAGWDGLRLSSVTGQGVTEVLARLATLVQRDRDDQPAPEAFAVHRPLGEGFRVERADGAFVVVGRAAERAVAFDDMAKPGALELAHGRLRRLGVDRALARAGARPGDEVRIGTMTFEYAE